ncbi:MAG: FHA domain-containing protein [Anaeromyxobacter sp.]
MAEIVVLNGVCAGTVFVLPDIPTVLGRSPESHLQIGDPWISSMHAMFERRGPEVWVIDLESRNGTFLADERVNEAKVPDGALLRFGKTEVRFAAVSSWEPVKKPVATPAPPRDREVRGTIKAEPAPRPSLTPESEDPLALTLRPAAVLRLSLHATGVAGAADAAARVRSALDACAAAIVNEGGVAARLAGVGLLGLFGLAGSGPDDVPHALRAARGARERVRELGGLDVRAGVEVGQVLAGSSGGPAGTDLGALGAAADRAERLAALATPGQILVGQAASALEPNLKPVGAVQIAGGALEIFEDATQA